MWLYFCLYRERDDLLQQPTGVQARVQLWSHICKQCLRHHTHMHYKIIKLSMLSTLWKPVRFYSNIFPHLSVISNQVLFRHRIFSLPSSLYFLFLYKLDEQMPHLPPPSSEAVEALVRELRVQLGMALFGVDVIINIHTHTLTVIDINIFPGG